MAADIKPELLMPAPQAAEGAPIIGGYNVVESGNARALALLVAYREGKAGSYRQHLEDQGYDVAGTDMPILVQRRTGEMTTQERAEFAREANARTTADRGASELATADAKSLTPSVMGSCLGGRVGDIGNRAFVRGFIETVVPPMERASMTAAQGELSQQGIQRVENAMFMAAYEDVEMLSRLREDTDNNVRATGGAMIEAAPAWAGMREAAKAGTIDPDVDVTPQLVEAVNLVRKSRNEGTPLAMLVGQTEMFSGEAIDPLTEAVLGVMYRDPGTWKKPLGRERVVTALKSVVDQANKTVVGEDLLGETTDVPGVLGAARRAALEGLADADAQADIFKSEKPADDGARTESAGEGRAGPDPGEAAARDGEEGAPSGEQGSEARVDQTRALATEVANRIARGEKLDNPALFALADEAFGGTVGDGTYDPQDAYNATELAINGMIAEADLRNLTPETAARFAEDMLAATAALPTQTRRTGEKIKFQQFSTPPAYAMAAAYTAAVKEGDRVLEPSAGVGGIAVAARSMGGDVTVNEISEKRAEGLRILGFDPTTEDAEQIANIMEPESFDVFVMNPPFSAAGKRGVKNSNTIGARHVSQAAKMLKPGGRLVTIMGEGFTPENARVRGLFSQMQKEGQFQAIVKMDGSKLYRKYGRNNFLSGLKVRDEGARTC